MAKPRMIRNGLSIGNNPLSYMGVEPSSPPDLAEYRRIPRVTDYEGFHVGDIWMANDPTLAPQYQVYLLLSLDNNIARWGQIYPSGAGAATDYPVDITLNGPAGPVRPFAFQVGVTGWEDPFGHSNIITYKDWAHHGGNGNYIEIDLNDTIDITTSITVDAYNHYGALVTDNTGLFSSSASGAAGTFMMSNGAAALPTFVAPTFISPAGVPSTFTAAGQLTFTSATLTITGAANTINFEVIGGGAVTDVRPDAGADVVPAAGLLKVYGAASSGGDINISTSNAGADTLGIALTDNISLADTNVAGTEGIYFLGGHMFINNVGTQNTFVGSEAGDLGLTVGNAINNVGVGYNALTSITDAAKNVALGSTSLGSLLDGEENTCAGYNSGQLITSGWWNTILGSSAGAALLTGSNNVIIGAGAGSAYVAAEDSNILLMNTGVVTESNTIRIGTQGAGAGQQQDAYMAGLYAPSVALGATYEPVLVDSNGKIGSKPSTNGQILIGATGGHPQWATLGSSDGSVTITNGAHSIDLVAPGGGVGGGLTTLTCDGATTATQDGAHNINLLGTAPITTTGAVNTATISLTNGANGQVLIGGGAGASWANITSLGGTVTITNGANTINLEAVGGGGGTTAFLEDDTNTAYPLAGVITIAGGDNIHTTGLIANTVTISLDYAIDLPITNAAFTQGTLLLAGTPFMHAYGTRNAFLGTDSGTVGITTAVDSAALGYRALMNVTSGNENVALGSKSLQATNTGFQNTMAGVQSGLNISSGGYNTGIGNNVLNSITSGSYNTCAGYGAGSSLTVGNSSNILIGNTGTAGLNNTIKIGTHGAGANQQNATYIAGIYNTAVGATAGIVLSDSAHKLGGLAGAAQTVLIGGTKPSFTGSPSVSGSVTAGTYISAGTYVNAGTYITAGTNITSTAGNLYLPATTAGGTQGVIYQAGVRLAHTYATNNVYFGTGAGRLTSVAPLTLRYNTGVGYHALASLAGNNDNNTTIGYNTGAVLTGSRNTFIGSGVGALATTTSDNIGIGYGSLANYTTSGGGGNNIALSGLSALTVGQYNIAIGGGGSYTGEGSNVVINNAGQVGDVNWIRIGTQGAGAGQQNKCAIAGIYGSTVAATGSPVYVDANGVLGTTGGYNSAFLAYNTINANNQIGDGTSYWVFGTTSVLDDAANGFDLHNNFDPGGGTAITPAYFTAPINGVYNFVVTITVKDIYDIVPPPPPPTIPIDPIRVQLKTSGGVLIRNFDCVNPPLIYAANNDGLQTIQFTVVTKMAATNRAYFSVSLYYGSGTKTLGIQGSGTWVSGNLVTPY